MEPHLNSVQVDADKRKYYGQMVMSTLKHLGVACTLADVVRTVVHHTGQPEEIVRDGVKKSLRAGARTGFIVKNGNTFSLPMCSNRFIAQNLYISDIN